MTDKCERVAVSPEERVSLSLSFFYKSVRVRTCVPLCARTCRVESLHLATAFLRTRIVSICTKYNALCAVKICIQPFGRRQFLSINFFGEFVVMIFSVQV